MKVGGTGSIKNGFIGPPSTNPCFFDNRLFLSGDFGPIAECDAKTLEHITYLGIPKDYKINELQYIPPISTGTILKTSDCHPDLNNKEFFFYHHRLDVKHLFLSVFTNKNKITTKQVFNGTGMMFETDPRNKFIKELQQELMILEKK